MASLLKPNVLVTIYFLLKKMVSRLVAVCSLHVDLLLVVYLAPW